MNEDGPVLDEAMENLKEAARLVRATQNRLWSAGKIDHPDYRELTHRLSRQYTATATRKATRTASMASEGNGTIGDYDKLPLLSYAPVLWAAGRL